MEQELTMEELIALINSQKGDFVIRVEFGEEAVSDAKDYLSLSFGLKLQIL